MRTNIRKGHQLSPLAALAHPEAQRGLEPQAARPNPMARALAAARRAGARGEVPVGAAVTDSSGAILAVRGNGMRAAGDACAHAEMLAMRAALRRLAPPGGRLEGCSLWASLEPCAMCAAAAGLLRVRQILFSAYDPKGGGVDHGVRIFDISLNSHQPEIIGGVREAESRMMLRIFFQDLRGGTKEKKHA